MPNIKFSRVKCFDQERSMKQKIYFFEEIKQNNLMNKKHKNILYDFKLHGKLVILT